MNASLKYWWEKEVKNIFERLLLAWVLCFLCWLASRSERHENINLD